MAGTWTDDLEDGRNGRTGTATGEESDATDGFAVRRWPLARVVAVTVLLVAVVAAAAVLPVVLFR